MITIPTVETCPYTESGQGVIHMTHPVLSILAGAVYDKLEWIAMMIGTRSPDGLTIHITGLRVPAQERDTVNCAFVKEEPLEADVVGVVHSHHNMTAFFSKTDDDTLNPRFPVSLVVAHTKFNSSEPEQLFGFTYQAEGRAPLPCGSNGIIDFTLLPDPLIDLWPLIKSPGFTAPNLGTPLHDCPHVTRTRAGMMQSCTTKCGITATEKATAIFGNNGKDFIKEVEHKTRVKQYINGGGLPVNQHDNRHYFGKGGSKKKGGSWADERDTYLRHWGEY